MQERFAPGTQLGPYRVDEVIGAGGMGQVYRACDTRLGRSVAIKASDERFSKRFASEARAISALSHPHICTLYDVGPDYLVMELVEGETLAERLLQGPIPLEEALDIASQIAEALEAAHEKGIVHRDLKPSNIKITPSGTVKVLDFGLAKLTPQDGDVATVTADRTRAGAVLGTFGYMAPEQIHGKPADKRADIWSFGVILYEMLAGEPPFGTASHQDTLIATLAGDPDLERVPFQVHRLLRHCLERDPRRRLRDIGDFRLLIENEQTAPPARVANARLPWGFALLAIVVATIAVAFAAREQLRAPRSTSAEAVHMAVSLPPRVNITRGVGYESASAVALSPDGRTLVIAGTDGESRRQLYARPLGRLDAAPIAGTEGGSAPFFSPDGLWIGFFADGRLKRVPASGGTAVDIAAAPGFAAGASWGLDDRIAFVFGGRSVVYAVDARGGTVEPLTRLEARDITHSSPEILPDRRTLLFDAADGWVHALDLTSGRRAALVEGANPRYVAPGHLLLTRGGSLLTAPFDPSRLEVTGAVIPLLQGTAIETSIVAGPHYAVSRSGSLAYIPGAVAFELVLRDPEGTEQFLTEQRPRFENPRFSPDGRRLAVAEWRLAGGSSDVWIHDLETGGASKLTFDGGRAPVWTPDGRYVTYSHLGERQGIYRKAADGSGDAIQLVALDEFHWLVGWTPDSRVLAFGQMERPTDDGVSRSSVLALADGEARTVVGPGPIWGGRLSPDGMWLAYYTLERGRYEVRVTPFPDGGTQYLITDDAATDPNWSPDGTEIYYRSGDRLWTVPVDMNTPGVRVGRPRLVVEPFRPPAYDDYHIHPDGRTLALVRPVDAAQGREVRVVLDGLTELERVSAQ